MQCKPHVGHAQGHVTSTFSIHACVMVVIINYFFFVLDDSLIS